MTTQSQSPAVVKFNIYFIKGLSFGSKDYTKELKTVECTKVFRARLANFSFTFERWRTSLVAMSIFFCVVLNQVSD